MLEIYQQPMVKGFSFSFTYSLLQTKEDALLCRAVGKSGGPLNHPLIFFLGGGWFPPSPQILLRKCRSKTFSFKKPRITISPTPPDFRTFLRPCSALGCTLILILHSPVKYFPPYFSSFETTWYLIRNKCPFGVFKSPQNQQNFLNDFCPSL